MLLVTLTLSFFTNSLIADTTTLPKTSLPKTNAVPGGIVIVDLDNGRQVNIARPAPRATKKSQRRAVKVQDLYVFEG